MFKFSMNKTEKKINKMLLVFTKLIAGLEKAISDLRNEVRNNEEIIASKQSANESYETKIKEYEALKTNLEGIVH